MSGQQSSLLLISLCHFPTQWQPNTNISSSRKRGWDESIGLAAQGCWRPRDGMYTYTAVLSMATHNPSSSTTASVPNLLRHGRKPRLRSMWWRGTLEGQHTRLGDRTHVGKGEGAPAAAFIGLFVAPQLIECTRLAEQCPDTLAVQAQRLLTVLQRLLIQALRDTGREPAGQRL